MTTEQFGSLLAATTEETTKNTELFRLYLRFLALTGGREKEAPAMCWDDVDLKRRTVTIGSGCIEKNHDARDVDFFPESKSLMMRCLRRGRPTPHGSSPPLSVEGRASMQSGFGNHSTSYAKKPACRGLGFTICVISSHPNARWPGSTS